MKLMKTALLSASILLFNTSPSYSNDYLALSAGMFDVFDDTHNAALFGAEYRMTPWRYGLRPTVGAFITGDSSFYGYGGLNWDVSLIDNQLYVVPNFMVGGYSDGDGKDLGGALEFRSGIELNYQLPNEHRLGLGINHISNAHIYDKNPGEETIFINYQVPIGTLFR